MFKYLVFIFSTCIPSLNYGMFSLSGDLSDNWNCIKQPLIVSEEEKKQQEKEDYDKLHSLVLSRISNKENLDEPISEEFSNPTPLSRACSRGDTYLSITQLLLAHGANPDVIDTYKLTPLHHAVQMNSIKTVKLLLASGAQPDSKDTLFGTPLQGICTRAHDVLNDESIAKKRVQIARLLLFYGANPNMHDDFERTCLYGVIARPFENLQTIDSLKNSNKALFFSQRKALIRALLEYGATLNARNSYGKTTIQQVYEPDNSKNLPYLIKLAQYALNYSNYLRTRLLFILGHSGTHNAHETPFKALPKDIVKYIIDFTYPAYNGPEIIKAQKT